MLGRLRLFFCLSCVVLLLAACGGGGGGGEVVTPSNLARASVNADGDVNYAGVSDFSGFSLAGTGQSAVSGGTVEIRKLESPSEIAGYIPAGPTYELTYYDKSGNKVRAPGGSVALAVPFSSSILHGQGADASGLVILSVGQDGGFAVVGGAAGTVNGSFTAATSLPSNPARFVAAFPRSFKLVQAILPLINIGFEGYKTSLLSRPTFKDPQGTAHPDKIKGREVRQIGSRVLLSARAADALGVAYTRFDWRMVSRPAGSSAAVVKSLRDNNSIEFVADVYGDYTVQLTATSPFVTDNESYTVRARNFTFFQNAAGTTSSYCVYCHSGRILSGFMDDRDIYGRQKLRDLLTPWKASKHGRAFETVKDEKRSLCMDCHTTGFLYLDRNGDGLNDYPQAQGYNSFITDWNNPAAGTLNTHLRGVTCESCHGPGGNGWLFPDGSGLSHEYKANIAVGPCFGCHEMPDGIPSAAHPQDLGDFHYNSNQANGGLVMKVDPCFQCHVGQAFINRVYNNGAKLKPGDVADPKGVTCATCHDPHGETSNPYYLRLYGSTKLVVNGASLTVNAGLAAVCYNCHNADGSLPNVTYDPHGNESEMVEGVGGYEYGDASPVVVTHGDRVKDKCVTCHMASPGGTTHRRLLYDPVAGTYNTAGCIADGCHTPGGDRTLPVSGDLFDFKGRRTEIRSLLAQLQARVNVLLGHGENEAITINYISGTLGIKLPEDELLAVNRAAYNYLFVSRDGSQGVHNYPYAKKLLTLSLNDLKRY